eukprot:g2692.t1
MPPKAKKRSSATSGTTGSSTKINKAAKRKAPKKKSKAGGSNGVKVYVRVRPLNRRETKAQEKACIAQDDERSVALCKPGANKGGQSFGFDKCYLDSSSQDEVFEEIGQQILEHAFAGFNSSLFAYGQTGAGKSYTMMGGDGEQAGIIPRLCAKLLEAGNFSDEMPAAEAGDGVATQHKLEVSYLEIYMEQVRDLLNPTGTSLRVREHPNQGPYVENLSTHAAMSSQRIFDLIQQGNEQRTVAATNANAHSSRSHAIFSLKFTTTTIDQENMQATDRASTINLVDLAGSERQSNTNTTGHALKEASNINLSLTQLGRVIVTLSKKGKGSKERIPYRDSVLTWLLKESLGGNAKTAMIANVSSAGSSYQETLRTLQYACQMKKISTKAKVNEDPNLTIIRKLKEQVQNLKLQLQQMQASMDAKQQQLDMQAGIVQAAVPPQCPVNPSVAVVQVDLGLEDDADGTDEEDHDNDEEEDDDEDDDASAGRIGN